MKKRIVILFSGEGTNLQNLIEKLHGKRFGEIRIEIAAAITNNPYAGGIDRARRLGIETKVIDHRTYASREAFDAKLVEEIGSFRPNLTVLAGFMRILTPIFTRQIEAVNIHPSLLPLFKGANAIERSFASQMKVAGVTIHRVDETLDGGTILAQRCFEKEEREDLESFKNHIHEIEYELYPETIVRILTKGH